MSDVQGAMQAIDTAINHCVDQWGQAVKEAIDNTRPDPGVDNTAWNCAWLAALGNMAWAATCVLPNPWLKALSFGGAGLASLAGLGAARPGSPVLATQAQIAERMKHAVDQAKVRFFQGNNMEDAKKHLYREIARQHPDWLAEYGYHGEHIRQEVWLHFFRSPYANKMGSGRQYAAELLKRDLEKALKEFLNIVADLYKQYWWNVVKTYQPPSGLESAAMSIPGVGLYVAYNQKDRHLNPAEFLQWLQTSPAYISRVQAFKTQHQLVF